MVAIEDRSTAPSRPSERARLAQRFVWVVAALGLAGVAALGLAYATSGESPDPMDAISLLSLLVSLVAFIVSGAVIVARRSGNPIGWLLMIPGLTVPASELALRWLAGLTPPPTHLGPGLWLVLWLVSLAWLGLIFPIFHILLTFPTGRLLSRRWRLAVALELTMIGVLAFIVGFGVELGPQMDDTVIWSVPNPVGFVPKDAMDGVLGTAWQAGLITLCVLGAAAIVIRYRRGTRDERQQLKWPLAGFLVFGATYATTALDTAVVGVLFAVGITAIPVSVAIAITRYRLYEIDRIIGRTVAYAVVTAVLAVAFLATNLAVQAVLALGTTFEVAVSTLVVAMLFQPVRRAIQQPIDRRFNRARIDAERMVAAFAARTRDEMDLPALESELSATAGLAVQPTSSAIWIRGAAS